MTDVHDGRVKVTPQVTDQVQHGRLDCHVQGGGRLVHDQQRRVVEQCHGDDHSLLLPAGQLVGIPFHHRFGVGHVHLLQHLYAVLVGVFFLHPPVDDQHLVHLLADAQRWIERRHGVLIDHGDLVPTQVAQLTLRPPAQFLSLEENAAIHNLTVAAQKVDDAKGDGALATA